MWELGGCIASKKMVGGCEIPMSSSHTHTHTHTLLSMKNMWWMMVIGDLPCYLDHLLASPQSSFDCTPTPIVQQVKWVCLAKGMRVSRVARIQNVKVLQFTWKHAFSYKAFVSFLHQIEHFKKQIGWALHKKNQIAPNHQLKALDLTCKGIGIVVLPVSQKKKKKTILRFITEL